MAVSKVTVGSLIAVQSDKQIIQQLPLESLPEKSLSTALPPNVPIQADSYFARESIGSVATESSFGITLRDTTSIPLQPAVNSVGKDFSLSVERPHILVTADITPSFSAEDRASAVESIEQSLDVLRIDQDLNDADYAYLMGKIESENEGTIADLKDALSKTQENVEKFLDSISRMSAAGSEFSYRMDFTKNWENFVDNVNEKRKRYSSRFDSQQEAISFDKEKDTSSSIILKVQNGLNAIDTTRPEAEVIQRLINEGTVHSTLTVTTVAGSSYDSLNSLQKFAVCCEVISKLFSSEFTRLKFGERSSRNVTLPIAADSRNRKLLFESKNFLLDENSGPLSSGRALLNVANRHSTLDLQEALASSIRDSIDSYESSSSLNETINNYDSIASPILESAIRSSTNSASSLKRISEIYDSIDEITRHKLATGFPRESCTSIDLFLEFLSFLSDCFPSYRESNYDTSFEEYEMINACLISLGTKRSGADEQISGLVRGILLASALDDEYSWAEPVAFDTVTNIETVTSVDGEEKRSQTATGQVTFQGGNPSVSKSFFYGPLYGEEKRRKLIPPMSRAFASEWLKNADEAAIDGDGYFPRFFTYGISERTDFDEIRRSKQSNTSVTVEVRTSRGGLSYELPGNSRTFFNKNLPYDEARILYVDRGRREGELDETRSVTVAPLDKLELAMKVFGKSRKSLLSTSIKDLYSRIVKKFNEAFKLQDQPSSFLEPQTKNVISKNSVYDLIYEAIANLVLYFVDPSTTLDAYQGTTTRSSESEITAKIYYHPGYYRVVRESTVSNPDATDYYAWWEAKDSLWYAEQLSSIAGDVSSRLSDLESSRTRTFGETSFKTQIPFVNDLTNKTVVDTQSKYTPVAILQLVSEIANSSASILESTINRELKVLKETDIALTQEEKIDSLKSLTPASVSASRLKYHMSRKLTMREFENRIEKKSVLLDISAAKWFFNCFQETTDVSRVIAVGLPHGFYDKISRQALEVNSFDLTLKNPDKTRNYRYYKVSADVQSMLSEANTRTTGMLAAFHPYIHIEQYDLFTDEDFVDFGQPGYELLVVLRLGRRFNIYHYDVLNGKWKLSTLPELSDFLSSIGIVNAEEQQKILYCHVMDSVLRSTFRITSGMEISADSLGTPLREGSRSDMNVALRIMQSGSGTLIPRGNMKAADFLTRNLNGNYGIIPYSRLRGESMNSTNPSDHSLLVRFLKTRIFTKSSLPREVIVPSAFERVYFFNVFTLIPIDAAIQISFEAEVPREADVGTGSRRNRNGNRLSQESFSDLSIETESTATEELTRRQLEIEKIESEIEAGNFTGGRGSQPGPRTPMGLPRPRIPSDFVEDDPRNVGSGRSDLNIQEFISDGGAAGNSLTNRDRNSSRGSGSASAGGGPSNPGTGRI